MNASSRHLTKQRRHLTPAISEHVPGPTGHVTGRATQEPGAPDEAREDFCARRSQETWIFTRTT